MKNFIKKVIFNLWNKKPKRVSRPQEFIKNPKKILFLRQDRIGDFIISTPIFKAIKEKYPSAKLDILLSKYNRSAFGMCGKYLRRNYVIKEGFWSYLKAGFVIRKEKYDIIIDLTDNPSTTSTIFMGIAKARINVGFVKDNYKIYNYIVPKPLISENHIGRRLLMLLLPFGIDINKISHRPEITVEKELISQYRKQFKKEGKSIGIIVSGSNQSKFWGFSNINDLLMILVRETEAQIFIYQTPQFPNVSNNFIENKQIHFLKPGKSISEFAALLAISDLIITPDTAAIHIGSALGIPQVVIFKVVDKKKYGIPWYPIEVEYKFFEDKESIKNINPLEVAKNAIEMYNRL